MDFGGSGSGTDVDADPASLLSSGLLFVFVGVLGENMVMILVVNIVVGAVLVLVVL